LPTGLEVETTKHEAIKYHYY